MTSPAPKPPATAKDGVLFKAARRIRQLLRSKLYYGVFHGLLLRSRSRAKHRKRREHAQRLNNHTYTSFYRSPTQLAALTGPVIDYLDPAADETVSITVLAASNGAEAYTIASELLACRPDVSFSIKASDLHEEMVQRGDAAVY